MSHFENSKYFLVVVFTGLTVVAIIFGFLRNMVMFYVLVKSTQVLHNRMFDSILRTPVRFFDINPIGKSSLTLLTCHL